MIDFKITITSEDLKDPAKLACVEAIVGSKFPEVVGYNFSYLAGVTPYGILVYIEATNSRHMLINVKEITLLYSQIKLDPRKLIGEGIPCVAQFNGLTSNDEIKGQVGWCIDDECMLVNGYGVLDGTIKLSPTWLRQSFKCEEI